MTRPPRNLVSPAMRYPIIAAGGFRLARDIGC